MSSVFEKESRTDCLTRTENPFGRLHMLLCKNLVGWISKHVWGSRGVVCVCCDCDGRKYSGKPRPRMCVCLLPECGLDFASGGNISSSSGSTVGTVADWHSGIIIDNHVTMRELKLA